VLRRPPAGLRPAITQSPLELSAHGAQPGQRASTSSKKYALALARSLDVVLVVVGAPVAIALGAPALGCVIGAVAWLVQRVLAQLDRRWIRGSVEPRTQLGLNLFEAFGRIWLLAGAIVLAAVLGGREDGLAAAVLIFCAYSVAFATRVVCGPQDSPRRKVAR
jgi:hypothetical protein